MSRRAWKATRPVRGLWKALPPAPRQSDPLRDLETAKDQARTLLRRYGIVFRTLLDRELPHLTWSGLVGALRLMELSGEVVAGAFVTGVPVPQFALRSSLEALSRPRQHIVWMSAVDPASPCALSLENAYDGLPQRVPGSHLVFRGGELVMTSRRHGRELSIRVPPDDPDLPAILAPLSSMVGRRWNPRSRVSVETINDVPVRESEYRSVLKTGGFRDEFKSYVLSGTYR